MKVTGIRKLVPSGRRQGGMEGVVLEAAKVHSGV